MPIKRMRNKKSKNSIKAMVDGNATVVRKVSSDKWHKTDKELYDIGMRAAKKFGDAAVKKAKLSGITGDKNLMDIRFKAEEKAHSAAVRKAKKRR